MLNTIPEGELREGVERRKREGGREGGRGREGENNEGGREGGREGERR